jgi:hypothetical protein
MYCTLMQFNEPCVVTACFDRFSQHPIEVCYLVQFSFFVGLFVHQYLSEITEYQISAKFLQLI